MPVRRSPRSRLYARDIEIDRLGVADKFERKPGDMRPVGYRVGDYSITYNPQRDQTTIAQSDRWPARIRRLDGNYVEFFQKCGSWREAFEAYRYLMDLKGQR